MAHRIVLFIFFTVLGFLAACGKQEATTEQPEPEEIIQQVVTPQAVPTPTEDPNDPPQDPTPDPTPPPLDQTFNRFGSIPTFREFFTGLYDEGLDPAENPGFVEVGRMETSDDVTTTYDCPNGGSLVTRNDKSYYSTTFIQLNYDATFTDCGISLVMNSASFAETINGTTRIHSRTVVGAGADRTITNNLQVSGEVEFQAECDLYTDTGFITDLDSGQCSFTDIASNIVSATYEEISAYGFPIYGPTE